MYEASSLPGITRPSGIPSTSDPRDAYEILFDWAVRTATELDFEARVEMKPLRADKSGVRYGHLSVWSLGHKRISSRIRMQGGRFAIGDSPLALSLERACYELAWLIRFALGKRPRSRRLT